MAMFEGTIDPGEEVVINCGGVWLKGRAMNRFEGGPGRLSALRVQPTEVLAGAFPPVNSLDELTVNANSWTIYRASDPLIVRLDTPYGLLAEAFSIFSSVRDSYRSAIAEDGELIVYESADSFSEAQLRRLRALGWAMGSDRNVFYLDA